MNQDLLQKYIAFTHKWEGGLSRDVNDSASKHPCPTPYNGKSGWHTNVGITYETWESMFGSFNDHRFFAMSEKDWFDVFKTLYWDKVKGDQLPDSIAIYVTGIAWGSGANRAGITLQTALRNLGEPITIDGDIGNKTIAATHRVNERMLFDELLREREKFFRNIAKPGSKNAKFLKGWLNRLEDYRVTFRP